jgi:hypothetical protein
MRIVLTGTQSAVFLLGRAAIVMMQSNPLDFFVPGIAKI